MVALRLEEGKKMGNEIIGKNSRPPEKLTFSVRAEGNATAVGYTSAVNTTLNVVIADGKKSSLSSDYFNLLMGFDPFSRDYVVVPMDRALTEYIQDDVKDEFGGWSEDAIEKIKKLPTVISMEADGTNEQQAIFAFIKDIKIQENGIKVYFQRYFPIPFSVLRENQYELALQKFEYTRTHWTIKKICLIEVLQDAGVFPRQ